MKVDFWYGVCRTLLDTTIMIERMIAETEDAVEIETLEEVKRRLRKEYEVSEKKWRAFR